MCSGMCCNFAMHRQMKHTTVTYIYTVDSTTANETYGMDAFSCSPDSQSM